MRKITDFNIANKEEFHVLTVIVTGVWCYQRCVFSYVTNLYEQKLFCYWISFSELKTCQYFL
jgi:hypothetical protein